MATLLPPPKRVKVYHGVPEPEKPAPEPIPNVVVQFVAEDDGKSLAPAVQLPANVSREDLELLVNRLSSKVRLSPMFLFIKLLAFAIVVLAAALSSSSPLLRTVITAASGKINLYTVVDEKHDASTTLHSQRL